MVAQRPELTGLRGLAAHVVVLSHVSNQTEIWGGLFGHGAGQVGVALFFVLSGYLMSTLYAERPYTVANVAEFAVHRCARVLPLFYVIVLGTFAVYLLTQVAGKPLVLLGLTSETIVHTLFLVKAPSILWTVPVEVQFYAMFILIWAFYRPGSNVFNAILMAGILICIVFGNSYGVKGLGGLAIWIPHFLVGALIGRVIKPDANASNHSGWSAGMIIALGSFVFLFPRVFALAFRDEPDQWIESVFSLTVIGVLLVTTLKAAIAAPIFANRFMQFSGQISYSIYLTHSIVLQFLLQGLGLGNWPLAILIATFVLAIGISFLSFKWIERPMRDKINRAFHHWRSGTRAEAQLQPVTARTTEAGKAPS